jgi:hypothetical protein
VDRRLGRNPARPPGNLPGVTEPQQDDLTDTDGLVQRTANGAAPDDPAEQPPQTPEPDLGDGQ